MGSGGGGHAGVAFISIGLHGKELLFVNEHNFTVKFKKNQAGFYTLKKKMLPFQISPSLVSHPNMGG